MKAVLLTGPQGSRVCSDVMFATIETKPSFTFDDILATWEKYGFTATLTDLPEPWRTRCIQQWHNIFGATETTAQTEEATGKTSAKALTDDSTANRTITK